MSKVAIVGAGAVGTAIAYAAQIRGACRELALFDLSAAKVRAELLDLNHGMQFTPMARITGSDDLEVCAGADDLLPALAPDALLVVTNPVDVVTQAALEFSGLPAHRQHRDRAGHAARC